MEPLTCAESIDTGFMYRPTILPLPGPGEVQVWRARTSRAEIPDWRAILPAGERERADRFVRDEDRRRFAVTRALLRIILGRYLGLAPQSLGFGYGKFGKPFLDGPRNSWGNAGDIAFNVAHSGDYSLLAFGVGLEFGIDVEHVRIERNIADLAKSLFPPAQCQELLMKPEAERKKDFLQTWTRREAIGKALGVGISLTPGIYKTAIVDASEWSIRDLEIAEDYVAALAARTRNMRVRLIDFPQIPADS